MGELVIFPGRDPLRWAGGSESYAIAHAHAARLAGYEPAVFAVGRQSVSEEPPSGPLHVNRTPLRPVRSTVSLVHRTWSVPPLVRHLRGRPGPHVIHAYGPWSDTAVAAARALRRDGVEAIPVVTSFTTAVHENDAKLRSGVVRRHPWWRLVEALDVAVAHGLTTPVEREALRRCAVVVVNYESVRELLQAAFAPLPEIRRLPYCPATAFDDEADDGTVPADLPAGDAPLVVAVSRHDPRKGLDLLLRALARLRDRGVAFRACLVGKGMLLGAHRRLATSLGLDDRVAIVGGVPAVMPYLRAADVFVLPSLEEGSGSVSVLEALQAGVAVVCTGVDGLVEDLTHDHDAILVEADSAAALEEGLGRALGDDDLRRRLGAEARRTYERAHSPQAVARALAALYGSLGLAPKTP